MGHLACMISRPGSAFPVVCAEFSWLGTAGSPITKAGPEAQISPRAPATFRA
jgi:hypothetical protein